MEITRIFDIIPYLPLKMGVKEQLSQTVYLSRREFLSLFPSALAAYYAGKLGVIERGLKFTDGIETSELVGLREEQGILATQENTSVLAVPLRRDFFYDETRPIELLNLPAGMRFGYKDIFTVRTEGVDEQITVLPHVTGDNALHLAFLNERALRYPVGGNVVGEYSYSDEVYPNKIKNISTAISSILDYQVGNGPFVPDRNYSLIEILRLRSGRDYVVGRTSTGTLVRGGGVCAVASTLSKSLLLADASFVEKWTHPPSSQYFVGPGDPAITRQNSDATIGIEADGNTYDFVWRMPAGEPLYLSATAAIIPNGQREVDNVGPGADARLILTLSWVRNSPASPELESIISLREAYSAYRETGRVSRPLQARRPQRTYWGEGEENERKIRAVYPEERITRFSGELSSDPHLEAILHLRELVDIYRNEVSFESFRENPRNGLGRFLQNSNWYQSLGNKDRADTALGHLNWNTYLVPGEALQCIGWTVLLSALDAPFSPRNVSGQVIRSAAELVPIEIRQRRVNRAYSNGLRFEVPASLGDVGVGDLFITYDTRAGHIGCVLARKEVNGKVVLLVSDANRKNDGRVRIFEVDESNFNAVFGEHPQRKVLIKRPGI